jgi:hypothetical protein
MSALVTIHPCRCWDNIINSVTTARCQLLFAIALFSADLRLVTHLKRLLNCPAINISNSPTVNRHVLCVSFINKLRYIHLQKHEVLEEFLKYFHIFPVFITVVSFALVTVISRFKPLKPSGHYMYRTAVTICTAQWSLYVPQGFTVQKFYVLPTQCLYVFCVDLTTKLALTDWFYNNWDSVFTAPYGLALYKLK